MVSDSTVGRRRLGIELRKLREQSELTNTQAAKQAGLSEATLSRIETGRRFAKPAELRELMNLYQVHDQTQRERLSAMSKVAAEENWWDQFYDVLPSGLGSYVGLEAEADTLRAYHSHAVHGLLQTQDYAHAIIQATRPRGLSDDTARLAELRMERQQVLRRKDPLRLWNIIDEAVLRRRVGGVEVMAAQLQHLLTMAEHTAVTLQVLPLTSGAHYGFTGPFTVIEFFDPQDRDHVYIEAPAGNLFLQKRELVAEFRERFSLLSAEALSPGDSQAMIAAIAKEYAE
jgi:transcriptional regulator with XRE-family HTH domain